MPNSESEKIQIYDPFRNAAKTDINEFSISELEHILINKKGINELKEKITKNGYLIFLKEFVIKKFLRKEIKVYKIYIPDYKIITKEPVICAKPTPESLITTWGPVNLPNNSNNNCIFENKHVILEFNISNITEQFGKFILNRKISFDNKIGFYIKDEMEHLVYDINQIKLDFPVKVSLLP